MKNDREAPLDDRYSTRTSGPDWIQRHTDLFTETFAPETFALIDEERNQPYEPDLASQIERFIANEAREAAMRRRVSVYNYKGAVEYALGKTRWDIFRSES